MSPSFSASAAPFHPSLLNMGFSSSPKFGSPHSAPIMSPPLSDNTPTPKPIIRRSASGQTILLPLPHAAGPVEKCAANASQIPTTITEDDDSRPLIDLSSDRESVDGFGENLPIVRSSASGVKQSGDSTQPPALDSPRESTDGEWNNSADDADDEDDGGDLEEGAESEIDGSRNSSRNQGGVAPKWVSQHPIHFGNAVVVAGKDYSPKYSGRSSPSSPVTMAPSMVASQVSTLGVSTPTSFAFPTFGINGWASNAPSDFQVTAQWSHQAEADPDDANKPQLHESPEEISQPPSGSPPSPGRNVGIGINPAWQPAGRPQGFLPAWNSAQMRLSNDSKWQTGGRSRSGSAATTAEDGEEQILWPRRVENGRSAAAVSVAEASSASSPENSNLYSKPPTFTQKAQGIEVANPANSNLKSATTTFPSEIRSHQVDGDTSDASFSADSCSPSISRGNTSSDRGHQRYSSGTSYTGGSSMESPDPFKGPLGRFPSPSASHRDGSFESNGSPLSPSLDTDEMSFGSPKDGPAPNADRGSFHASARPFFPSAPPFQLQQGSDESRTSTQFQLPSLDQMGSIAQVRAEDLQAVRELLQAEAEQQQSYNSMHIRQQDAQRGGHSRSGSLPNLSQGGRQSPMNPLRMSSPGPSPLRNEQRFASEPPAPAISSQGNNGAVTQGDWQGGQSTQHQSLNNFNSNLQQITQQLGGLQIHEQLRLRQQQNQQHLRNSSNDSNSSAGSNSSLPFGGSTPSAPRNGQPLTIEQMAAVRLASGRPPSRGANPAVDALPSISQALLLPEAYRQGPMPMLPSVMPPGGLPMPPFAPMSGAIPPRSGQSTGPIPVPPTASPYSRAEIHAHLHSGPAVVPPQRGFTLPGPLPPTAPHPQGPGSQAQPSPVIAPGNTAALMDSIAAASAQGALTPDALNALIRDPGLANVVLRLATLKQQAPPQSPSPSVSTATPSSNGSSNPSLGPSANNRKAGLYKTELCRSWEEKGQCRYGGKCQFAHGRDELRIINRHPKYKTEVCRTFWLSGSCPYGKRCCFIHTTVPSSLQATSPEVTPGLSASANSSGSEAPPTSKHQEPVSRIHHRISSSSNSSSQKMSFGPSLSLYLSSSDEENGPSNSRLSSTSESSPSSPTGPNSAFVARNRSASLADTQVSESSSAINAAFRARHSLDGSNIPSHYSHLDRQTSDTPSAATIRNFSNPSGQSPVDNYARSQGGNNISSSFSSAANGVYSNGPSGNSPLRETSVNSVMSSTAPTRYMDGPKWSHESLVGPASACNPQARADIPPNSAQAPRFPQLMGSIGNGQFPHLAAVDFPSRRAF